MGNDSPRLYLGLLIGFGQIGISLLLFGFLIVKPVFVLNRNVTEHLQVLRIRFLKSEEYENYYFYYLARFLLLSVLLKTRQSVSLGAYIVYTSTLFLTNFDTPSPVLLCYTSRDPL